VTTPGLATTEKQFGKKESKARGTAQTTKPEKKKGKTKKQ